MSKDIRMVDWHKLDNNANLFTATASRRLSNVFRLSAVLKEDIQEELLQEAVERVLPKFSAFNVRLKKGVFWNYFEENDKKPIVQKERDFPNRYMDPYQNNLFLFRVSYYKKRINLEIFHALTDATGGIQFLQAICYQYIMLSNPDKFTAKQKESYPGISYSINTEDSYVKNYVPVEKEKFDNKKAYMIEGEKFSFGGVGVIHGNMKTSKVLEVARKYDATITQYICACIQWGIYNDLNKTAPKHPINVFIPVNLRPFYKSTTALNFFSGINISMDYKDKDEYTFTDILTEVKKQFEEKLTREAMAGKLAYTVGDGYSLPARIVPLPLKSLFLLLMYNFSKRSNTITFSNVGRVNIIEEFEEYFEKFYFVVNASQAESTKAGVVSCGENIVLTITSTVKNPHVEKHIFRKIRDDGIDITIESNGVYNELL